MLAGIRGGLVSEYFAEHLLSDFFAGRLGERERDGARTALARLTRSTSVLGPASSLRTIFDVAAAPLVEMLGYRALSVVPALDRERLVVVLEARGTRVAMIVLPWADTLDGAWRAGMLGTIETGARWCVLFNGKELRLLDSWRSYSREHATFDLELVAADGVAFAVFWALVSAVAHAPGPDGTPLLDAVIAQSLRHAVRVCKSLRHGVLEALVSLMHGFAGTRRVSRAGSKSSTPAVAGLFEQSLTIVYRMLFLLFAEARRLVPTWSDLYATGYSMEMLRALAEAGGSAAHPGLWETFQAMSRLAHRGCRAGTLVVTPFNGRLFSPARTPLAESGGLSDDAARRAVMALSITSAGKRRGGRARIAYQDLGVEELGSVYESVLDYEPRIENGRSGPDVVLVPGSGKRKATGTFYTPRSLTGYLVRRTLQPIVHALGADEILKLRVVDPAMGSGAFLVSACHYLSTAYEAALVAEGRCHAGDIDEPDRAGFRRLVAQRCLYGVDLNPTAVQLARLSLWLATLAANRPLTFLDHHLAVGDSLVGGSPLDVLRTPRRGLKRTRSHTHPMLFDLDEMRAELGRVLPARAWVSEEPGDTLQAVREKEQTIESLTQRDSALGRWKRAGDLWCACWFVERRLAPGPGAYREALDLVLGRTTTAQRALLAPLLDGADGVAAARRFFHWQMEFPEVFFDGAGCALDNPGFDAVIGNPPWDMLRADTMAPAENRDYDKSLSEFSRNSQQYSDQSAGHPNRFQLFVERALQLARRGGRIGLVVPWGLLTDHGCGALRRRLFLRANTDTIVSFDNSRAIFPIHRSVRFALLTATAASRTTSVNCRLRESDPAALDSLSGAIAADHYPLTLSPQLLGRLSGDDLAVPDVRTPIDLEILEQVSARCPWISAERGWHAHFGRELNATDDRPHFVELTATGGLPSRDLLPVVEGKHLSPFSVRLDACRLHVAARVARRLLARDGSYGRARLAYRDVASATNRVTLIAAILPPDCVSTHTVFCLKTPLEEQSQWFLCGVMNSYIANYLVRMRVTTHVSASIVQRLPVPFQQPLADQFAEVARLARQIASGAGEAIGDRLQGIVAKLYGLSGAQFAHVLETFPLVERQRRDGALALFKEAHGGHFS